MSTENIGASLRADDPEARSMAARMLGSARTERKKDSSRANVAKATEARKGKPMSEEHKEKLRQSYNARRGTLGLASPVEKKPVGRPRKQTTEGTEATPKRGRGRPKKQTGGTPADGG